MQFKTKKIVGQNYSHLIFLPIEWVRYRGLNVGDEVGLQLTESGDLVIKPIAIAKADACAEEISPLCSNRGRGALPLPRGRGGKKRR